MWKKINLLFATSAVALMLGACGSSSAENAADGDKETITFVNHKTDWENEEWPEMISRFNEKYPNIEVKVETLSDYDSQIAVRMNGTNYGDVLVLPSNQFDPEQFPNFFEPLGTTEELSQDYLSIQDYSFDGNAYGMPMAEHFEGMLYNKALFAEAGIEELPKTADEFISAMKAIKEKTGKIPVYTNYAAGWPLTNWDNARFMIAANGNVNNEMLTDREPFREGSPLNQSYNLLYRLAKEGLIESDPTTSDWDQSRQMMADGEIGVMFLGSWLIQQVKDISDTPDDIGYMAYPSNKDGDQYAFMYSDYNLGINVNSKHKEAAKTFIDWFAEEGNYTDKTGQIPAKRDAEWPEELQKLVDDGVKPVFKDEVAEENVGKFEKINSISEIGLDQPNVKRRLIEAGIGNSSESFEDIMEDLNNRWAKGIDEVN